MVTYAASYFIQRTAPLGGILHQTPLAIADDTVACTLQC